ncbi:hypothetical protein OIDMADRAFT_46884 [Oidiodendron maius Zn]|uniref:Uncharacterized protein n=1 Tax=Oidiodendron maius (strain Zn) TaxID=913774 RepID=A0A0C3D6M3_OIDMZ|nr:hypothetical protein OIDMADRAFT_46884 [Oidiodendron maius Zn]
MSKVSNALGVCSNSANGACVASSCKLVDIGVGETIELPGTVTECLFNTATDDPGFDGQVCRGGNGGGPCFDLKGGIFPSTVVTGDINWVLGDIFRSFVRTGN